MGCLNVLVKVKQEKSPIVTFKIIPNIPIYSTIVDTSSVKISLRSCVNSAIIGFKKKVELLRYI